MDKKVVEKLISKFMQHTRANNMLVYHSQKSMAAKIKETELFCAKIMYNFSLFGIDLHEQFGPKNLGKESETLSLSFSL